MRYLYLVAADLRGTVFDVCDFTKAPRACPPTHVGMGQIRAR